MLGAAILVILAIGALLVPELRAEPGTWIVSGVFIALAGVILVVGRARGTRVTARQLKYARLWGYTSHDGTGERDAREKLGE